MQRAVAVYHVVITYGAESSGLVPGSDVRNCIVTTFGSVGTMDDDFIDAPHFPPPFHVTVAVSSATIFSVMRT